MFESSLSVYVTFADSLKFNKLSMFCVLVKNNDKKNKHKKVKLKTATTTQLNIKQKQLFKEKYEKTNKQNIVLAHFPSNKNDMMLIILGKTISRMQKCYSGYKVMRFLKDLMVDKMPALTRVY